MNKPCIYPHPLDYAAGIKYCLTALKAKTSYIINPSSFYVEEVVDWAKLGFSKDRGQYVVLKLEKKGIDTLSAISKMERLYGLPHGNLVFLGLKDRDATAVQYLFVRKELLKPSKVENEALTDKLHVRVIGYCRRRPRRKHLLGNRFRVIVNLNNNNDLYIVKRILRLVVEHGLPSYYGYQRFGIKRSNSHLLGKYTLLGRLDLLSFELLHGVYPYEAKPSIIGRLAHYFFPAMSYERRYLAERDLGKAISRLKRETHSILISAYAAYLYNLLLNKVIERKGWNGLKERYPGIGCQEAYERFYREILEIESVLPAKLLGFRCWYREGAFKPLNISLRHDNDKIIIEFTLKRGFYATIVLREIFKDSLKFNVDTM